MDESARDTPDTSKAGIKERAEGNDVKILVTRFFRELGDTLVETGEIRLPSVPAGRLSRILDSSFSDPVLIGDVVELLLDIRSKLPGWPGRKTAKDRFDGRTLASIRERGFLQTYRHSTDRDRIDRLYRRMLIDEALLLDAQDAIWGTEEMSPFWTARIYAPKVQLVDLETGLVMGATEQGPGKPVIDRVLRIEDDVLVATLRGMNGNTGRQAEYVLRPAKDRVLTTFYRPVAKKGKMPRRIDSRRWPEVYGSMDRPDPRRGQAKVRRDGKLIFKIRNRPPDVEMKESILVVALIGKHSD